MKALLISIENSPAHEPYPSSFSFPIDCFIFLYSSSCHPTHIYSRPSVSLGDWFQDLLQIPKSKYAQVPWSDLCICGPTSRDSISCRPFHTTCFYWKKNPCMSGPAEFNSCCSRVNCIYLFIFFSSHRKLREDQDFAWHMVGAQEISVE